MFFKFFLCADIKNICLKNKKYFEKQSISQLQIKGM